MRNITKELATILASVSLGIYLLFVSYHVVSASEILFSDIFKVEITGPSVSGGKASSFDIKLKIFNNSPGTNKQFRVANLMEELQTAPTQTMQGKEIEIDWKLPERSGVKVVYVQFGANNKWGEITSSSVILEPQEEKLASLEEETQGGSVDTPTFWQKVTSWLQAIWKKFFK